MIGNFRKAVRKQLEDRLIEHLPDSAPSQGRLLHQFCSQTVSLWRRLHRLHDPRLFTFFLRAITMQLPTATNLLRGSARTDRTLECPLCRQRSSSAHALSCPTMRRVILDRLRDVPTILTNIVEPLLAAPHLPSEDKFFLTLLPSTVQFYNPLCPPDALYFGGYNWNHTTYRVALQTIDSAERYPSMLGIIPPALRSLLSPSLTQCGFADHQQKAIREQQERGWEQLQLHLLRASHCIFRRWRHLCRAAYTKRGSPASDTLQGFAN